MILKRMNYKESLHEELASGKYKTYEFEIWNRSGVPTAYIKFPIDILSNEVLKTAIELKLVVHGGITFTGNLNYREDSSAYWIGWDYGHAGDYMNLPGIKLSGQRWTTRKIYKEVKNVIRQIISLKLKYSIVIAELEKIVPSNYIFVKKGMVD